MNLLSFAESEDYADQKNVETKKKKLQSSHDALNDPSLSKEYAVSPEILAKEKEKLRQAEEKKEKLMAEISEKKRTLEDKVRSIISADNKPENRTEKEEPKYSSFENKMKEMLIKKRRLMDDLKKVDDEEIGAAEDSEPVVIENANKSICNQFRLIDI